MINQFSELQALIHIQRRYAVPRERVFRAWTEPQALERWFKPFGLPISVAHLDLRRGGRYQFDIYQPNGEISTISGQYIEILAPEKLVYTWVSAATDSHETLVSMRFTEQNAVTEISLIHERFSRGEQVQAHHNGWLSMFSSLDTIFSN